MSSPPVLCRTCKSSHVKDYEFPCRECCSNDLWEFAPKDPWPMFPMKNDPWKPAAHPATKEPR